MPKNNEQKAPALYRVGLLRHAKASAGKYYSQGERVQDIAAALKLSINTVSEALKGRAVRVDTLWKLCNYYKLDWTRLFDVTGRFMKKDEDLAADFSAYCQETTGELAAKETALIAAAWLKSYSIGERD